MYGAENHGCLLQLTGEIPYLFPRDNVIDVIVIFPSLLTRTRVNSQ